MGLQQIPAQAGLSYNVVSLTSSGSYTIPSNVSMIDILMIGGGQGGWGFTAAAVINNGNYGNSAAPGAVVYVKEYPVTSGASISYTIGAGGAGGVGTGSTNASFAGAVGGTTTFDNLKAPGACVKFGPFGSSPVANDKVRGGWGLNLGTQSFYQVSQANYDSSYNPVLYGFPEGFNSHVIYTDFYYGATSTAGQTSYPEHTPGSGGTAIEGKRFYGISKTYSKLLAGLTAPTGAASATTGSGRTLGARTSGWAGFGGESTGDPTGWVTGYGGGGGATGQFGTAGTTNGGAAGTNSGSGGGSGLVTNPASGPSVRNANGGAGGSGIIVIGYWG